MATFGTQVRRGLPRRPGGEPWPPAREDAEDQVPAASVVERAERDETLAAGIVIAQSPVAGSDAADARVATAEAPVAPQSPVAGSDAADARPVAREPVGSAGAGSAHTLRRGLPRTPGGEPWPPADAVAAHSALSAAAPVADAAPSAERMKRDETPAGAAIAAAGAAVGDRVDRGESPAAATPATSTDVSLQDAAVAPTATGGVALRRGLPRVAGGEPWPPAGVVPDRTAAAAAAAVAGPAPAAVAAGPAPAPEVAPAAAAAATPEPSPTDLAETPPIPAAAGAVPTAAAVDLSVPLPFTRTVFPGANAFTHVPPAAEPERIGPFTRLQWAGAAIVGGGGLLFAAGMAVLLVRWLLSLEFMQDFLTAYPGEYELPVGAPVGIPPWLGWQHFFNVFLIVLIIRSGLQVRTEKRPTAFWSPRSNGKRKISLNLWLHQSLDILWIVNGVIYVVLLLATGQWMKIVPTSWEVFPNAVSAALQYVSLDWPTENGWVNYNSLQQLAYFATVFLAAPLAIATGVRMSGIWPSSAKTLSRIYPVEWARAIHFPVMLYFVAFILVHVALVLATSALRNLNHMYASQDVVNWTGFWIFAASLVVIAAGWVAARPLVLAPVARLFGNVSGR